MIDSKHIGLEVANLEFEVEAGRVRAFAKAIGETDPIYFDVDAAQRSGYRSLPAPPTFLFGTALEGPDPFGWVQTVERKAEDALHGTQTFVHHEQVCAGDRVSVRAVLAEAFDKANGSLEFVVQRGEVRDGKGLLMCEMETVTIFVARPESGDGE